MAEPAVKKLTFREFTDLNLEGRYELVDGRLEELVPPRPRHGWACFQLGIELGVYLRAHQPDAYAGPEVDIPTVPYHGRRPDLVYYSLTDQAARLDLAGNRVLGPPTLAIETLSEEDEERDTVTKRQEYARAGIAHYWIVDPERRSITTLVLSGQEYELGAEFSGTDILTTDLFPGLEIPLARLFR